MCRLKRTGFIIMCVDFVMIWTVVTCTYSNFSHVDVGSKLLSRPKRQLIFPDGSNFQLVFCLTIGAYTFDETVMGSTAGLAWELPTTADSQLQDLLPRRSRSILFPKVEALLQSIGVDGRSCILKALCEAAQRDHSTFGTGTFLQEILHAIFTLPRDGRSFKRAEHQVYDTAYNSRDDCTILYPGCRHSIYDVDF